MKGMGKRAARVVLEGVGLSFGATEVLKKIDLEIEPGEFFAFLGPSGSGKSTLLRAVAGFGPAPRGRILIGEQDVARLPPWKRDVGMVFQNYALWPHMTVRRNVAFGLEERKLPAREIRKRVGEALELVGLSELAERRPSELSGGQQQRVAIARTIVVEPKVLLLDEPLSNLDAGLRIQMRREIRELQRRLELTTIFVTHDQEEANTTSDRIAVLNDGVLQQVGTPMELYDNPANLFVARFLGTANILRGEVEESRDGVRFESDQGIAVPVETPLRGFASILFRPQNVAVHVGEGVGGEGGAGLSGTVTHVEFLGNLVRYTVETGGETILAEQPHQQGESSLARGTPVLLGIDPKGVVVLRD